MIFRLFPVKPWPYFDNKGTWFAWRPVITVSGAIAWLETVEFDSGYAVGIGAWKRYRAR